MGRTTLFLRTVLVIALAVLVTACGGGGDDDASDAGAPPEASESSAESADDAESDPTAFCEAVDAFADDEQKLQADLEAGGFTVASNKKVYGRFLEEHEEEFQAMVDAAPADLKEAAEAYVETYRLYAKVGGTDIPNKEKLQEESTKIIAYYQSECS